MEQFDILDKNGNPTGLTADKGSRLSRGQYYLGTHAYILNSSLEFLIQQRAFTKKFLPGGWDVHLEHVIAGETSQECVLRGLDEEIGLFVSEADILTHKRFVWEEYNHLIDVYFFQVEFELNLLTLQKDEVVDVKAVPLDDMSALVSKMHYRPDEYRQYIMGEIKRLSRKVKNAAKRTI